MQRPSKGNVLMVKMVPYTPEHGQEIAEKTRGSVPLDVGDVASWAVLNASSGPAWAIYDENGALIACAGVRLLSEGVGEAWLVADSRGLLRNILASIGAIRGTLDRIRGDLKLRRVQGYIREDWPQAVKFAEFLGFRREGLMRKFNRDGVGSFMYALTED